MRLVNGQLRDGSIENLPLQGIEFRLEDLNSVGDGDGEHTQEWLWRRQLKSWNDKYPKFICWCISWESANSLFGKWFEYPWVKFKFLFKTWGSKEWIGDNFVNLGLDAEHQCPIWLYMATSVWGFFVLLVCSLLRWEIMLQNYESKLLSYGLSNTVL